MKFCRKHSIICLWLGQFQACPSLPPWAFVEFLSSSPSGGIYQKTSARVGGGGGNIFNTHAFKWYARFSLHHFSTPQYFLHPLPAIVISSHMEVRQSMYCLKSLKEKTLSLHVNCQGREAKKNSARHLKANKYFVYSTIHVNATNQWFHRGEKILRPHVKHVSCLLIIHYIKNLQK